MIIKIGYVSGKESGCVFMGKLRAVFVVSVMMFLVSFSSLGKAGAEELEAAESSNCNHSFQVRSNLVINSDGTFSRIEKITKGTITVENYSSDFTLLGSKTLSLNLPEYIGFYFGKKYNFVISGQRNDEEIDDREVVNVAVYNKAWEKINSVGITARDSSDTGTRLVFGEDARFGEKDGMFYIHAERIRYADALGVCHQENKIYCINEETWEWTTNDNIIVSHSFDEYILPDEAETASQGGITLVNLCDGYPKRSVLLSRLEADSLKRTVAIPLMPVYGEYGDNYTGVRIGGAEQSSSHYLTAVNSVFQDEETYTNYRNDYAVSNIYVLSVPKEGLSEENVVRTQITNYNQGDMLYGSNLSTPKLVKLSDDSFLLMWSIYHDLYYVMLDAAGNPVGDIRCKNNAISDDVSFILSDCQPVVYQGKVIWYTTNGFHASVPVFLSLEPVSGDLKLYGDVSVLKTTSNITEDTESGDGEKTVVGQICTIGKLKYRITSVEEDSLTVEVAGITKKGCKKLVIPDEACIEGNYYEVIGIADGAFRNCTKLKEVELGRTNIRYIGKKAFMGCKRLKEITLSRSVREIGKKAFYGCRKLEDIYDGYGVTSIGKKAFKGCKSLYGDHIRMKKKMKKIVQNQNGIHEDYRVKKLGNGYLLY